MRRMTRVDGHVEVAKAYYEVPAEYGGREVWVRWDAATVRVFNHRFEQITIHARLDPGRFSAPRTTRGRACGIERSSAYYRTLRGLPSVRKTTRAGTCSDSRRRLAA